MFRVAATKGSNQPGHALVSRPTISNVGEVQLYAVGTDSAKDTLFSRLKLEKPGPGYCHHPDLPAYEEKYFDQLTAEEKFNKYDKGVLKGTYYKKVRERNEALDLKVLNMVAFAILNPNLPDLAYTMGQKVLPVVPAEPVPLTPNRPPNAAPRQSVLPKRRGRGFVTNW
jgi:phage terminase large subunit GpA-like protein